MNLKLLINNYERIKKIILSLIFVLLTIILVSFFYHQYLYTDLIIKKNITDLSSSETFLSYNQDYVNSIIEVKNIDSWNFQILNKDFSKDKNTWKYSPDNGTSWINIPESSVTLNVRDLKLKYILISITDTKLNEEITFLLDVPEYREPTVLISYSSTTPTKESVTATIISTASNITITNNDGKDTYTFTKNGSFTFEYKDELNNPGTIEAKVDWITESIEPATIIYDITSITNKPVTAFIQSEEEITITNNNGLNTYIFKENGTFTFEYKDSNGNLYTLPAEVTWIDKTPPLAKITYDITDKTTEEVTATLTNANENIIITNNDGLDTYTFKENGQFTFQFEDEAGNKNELTASVTWIEKIVETPPKNDQPKEPVNDNQIYLSKDAMSKKTTYTVQNVSLKVPTYQVKEPLTLKSKELRLTKEIKETLGNRLEAISLSLVRSNETRPQISDMKVSFELDPEKKFLGIYKMNNDLDIEELYYKKTDKNHIELDIQTLGNYILSYAKKNLTPIKIKQTSSDLQIIVLFATSIALITTGITVFKKSRQ